MGTPKRKSGTCIKKCKCLFLFAANLLLTTRVFGATILPCSPRERRDTSRYRMHAAAPSPPLPHRLLPFSGNPLSEPFPFGSLCDSNHTVCRFAENAVFPLDLGRATCVAASRFGDLHYPYLAILTVCRKSIRRRSYRSRIHLS